MGWEYEIPKSTAEGFLEKHREDYTLEELDLIGELADEAWFRAKEEKIEQDADFRAGFAYTDPEFIPDSRYQEDLTMAIENELDLGLFKSAQLAADLMRSYDGTEEGLDIEVGERTYHL